MIHELAMHSKMKNRDRIKGGIKIKKKERRHKGTTNKFYSVEQICQLI